MGPPGGSDGGAHARLDDRVLRDRPPRPIGRDGDGVDVVGALLPAPGAAGGLHARPARRFLRLCRRRHHEQGADGSARARRRCRSYRGYRRLARDPPPAAPPGRRGSGRVAAALVRDVLDRPRPGVRGRRRALRRVGLPTRRADAARESLGPRVRLAVDDLPRRRGRVVAVPTGHRAPADRGVDLDALAADRAERYPSSALSDPDLSGAGAPRR